jgi:hypothetical protein
MQPSTSNVVHAVLGATVSVAALLGLCGVALMVMRSRSMRLGWAQHKRMPPALGQPVTLVLTDIEGSTEMWEWDTEIAAQVGARGS